MHVNNNIHNNLQLQGACFQTALHTSSPRGHGGWLVTNTRAPQKQNPKALQENPARQQALEGKGHLESRPLPLAQQARPSWDGETWGIGAALYRVVV